MQGGEWDLEEEEPELELEEELEDELEELEPELEQEQERQEHIAPAFQRDKVLCCFNA